MCGRATLVSPIEAIAEMFDCDPIDIGPPRYNIAPTQAILAIRDDPSRGRALAVLKWGLIPWWAKPDEARKIAARCIQARSETVKKAPAFRDAFQKGRCLIVADGFYEWKTSPDGKRTPHHIRFEPQRPFAIAGLWDSWQQIETGVVLTTKAAGAVQELHHRMPLIIAPKDWDAWLTARNDDAIPAVMSEGLVAFPVSTWVNSANHEGERCLAPPTPDKQLALF